MKLLEEVEGSDGGALGMEGFESLPEAAMGRLVEGFRVDAVFPESVEAGGVFQEVAEEVGFGTSCWGDRLRAHRVVPFWR